jgi:hypothetical protein
VCRRAWWGRGRAALLERGKGEADKCMRALWLKALPPSVLHW